MVKGTCVISRIGNGTGLPGKYCHVLNRCINVYSVHF